MNHYCTLFDINYAAKGLSLYESLRQHSSESFTLHILAMDDEVFWMLEELALTNVRLIPYQIFESDMRMASVKGTRSWKEYCWTCASQLMEYLQRFSDIDRITYLDADIFFFSDPRQIFDEMGHQSIGITPHRFTDKTPIHVLGNGTFNVGIVSATNNRIGKACIGRWAAQVREWCYDRVESAHACGDQKYLDEWTGLYGDEVAVINHPGINLGPWALANYHLVAGGYQAYPVMVYPFVKDILDLGTAYPLVAYHFHEFAIEGKKLTDWPLRPTDIDLIYSPYILAIRTAMRRIEITERILEGRREYKQRQAERV